MVRLSLHIYWRSKEKREFQYHPLTLLNINFYFFQDWPLGHEPRKNRDRLWKVAHGRQVWLHRNEDPRRQADAAAQHSEAAHGWREVPRIHPHVVSLMLNIFYLLKIPPLFPLNMYMNCGMFKSCDNESCYVSCWSSLPQWAKAWRRSNLVGQRSRPSLRESLESVQQLRTVLDVRAPPARVLREGNGDGDVQCRRFLRNAAHADEGCVQVRTCCFPKDGCDLIF